MNFGYGIVGNKRQSPKRLEKTHRLDSDRKKNMENDTTKKSFWRKLRFSGLVVREVIGWLLMLLGLYVFYICQLLLMRRAVVEGFAIAIIGIVIFRSGLQLVKVAVAARAFRADRRAVPDSDANQEFSPAR